jgi:CRISPR/Cas system-associated exonuclease Cas4 (RecB family)
MTISLAHFSINDIINYIVCPSKAYLITAYANMPYKEKVKDRVQKSIFDVVLRSVGMMGIDRSSMDSIISLIFSDLMSEEGATKDIDETNNMLNNLDALLKYNELKIDSPGKNVEVKYYNAIITSYYDAIIHDTKSDKKYPAIIDISKTRYEPYYNPIVYRCQTILDNMDILGTNTEIMVLSVANNKIWEYNKLKYNSIVKASIIETIAMMNSKLYPARFSWICAGCSYRGICHQLTRKRNDTVIGK